MNSILTGQAVTQEANTSASTPTQPTSRVHFAAAFLLAFAVRLAIACTLLGHDPKLSFFNQASELGCLAQSVLTGHGFASPFGGNTGPSAFLAPGYPLLVALTFRLFGAYTGAAAATLVLCQVLFGSLTVPVLMSIANRLFGTRTANIAGALCAAIPTLIFLPLVFWESSLSSLLLLTAIVLALRCGETPRPAPWIAFGLLCGLTMLINPALMLVLVAALAWTTWRMRPASLLHPCLALAAWLLIFFAWPIRNQVALHTFIPLRSNLGYELWQGNRPGSNGDFAASLHPNINAAEHQRYAQLGEVAYMSEKSSLARAAIQSDPTRFLKLSVIRMARFWTGITPTNHSLLIIADICLTSILAGAGLLWLCCTRPMAALLLAAPFLLYPVPYYFTHADFRFRLVLEPLALLLSVYAIQRIPAAVFRVRINK